MHLLFICCLRFCDNILVKLVLYVGGHGMKWVTLTYLKVITIVFYFCYDSFIELYLYTVWWEDMNDFSPHFIV